MLLLRMVRILISYLMYSRLVSTLDVIAVADGTDNVSADITAAVFRMDLCLFVDPLFPVPIVM